MKPPLVAVAVAAALAAAACKKKAAPPPTTTIAGDAAVAAPDVGSPALDEATLRAGKRTGLGGPDEQPEVATEDLARGLLMGTTRWSRVVSPTTGVVELRVPSSDSPADRFLGRRCGAAVDTALGDAATAMLAALAQPELGYELVCDNSGLVAATPPSALCSIDSPAADSLGYDLVFVPDPTLGLRLVGVTIVDGGPGLDAEIDAFDLELAKTGKLCP